MSRDPNDHNRTKRERIDPDLVDPTEVSVQTRESVFVCLFDLTNSTDLVTDIHKKK